ncbi:hypothetical protein [Puniceicoccus vermicola]|uniref:Uncharacterized protein n=1 Tax=Puniceicoccus vermicola TaxID=388746 RepID=A0A7X1AWM8_9BACT|nr:hypothetical protein [Puniceicoccus vermicola]MBC2601287.1 hypothetical protein [Puniceicoccus vermicola]
MYGYIFAIIGILLLIILMVGIFSSGTSRKSKSTHKDIEKGTSYAEPQAEQVDPARRAQQDSDPDPKN